MLAFKGIDIALINKKSLTTTIGICKVTTKEKSQNDRKVPTITCKAYEKQEMLTMAK